MDWRDAYPGINAATLMEMQDPVDPRQQDILPVIKYAVKQRLNSKKADYWDYATLLELAVLDNDQASAASLLGNCLVEIREIWEPESTARNLNLIWQQRKKRNEQYQWIVDIEEALLRHSK